MLGKTSFEIFSMEILFYDFFNFLSLWAMWAVNLLHMKEKAKNLSFISRYIIRVKGSNRHVVRFTIFMETVLITVLQLVPGVFFNQLLGLTTNGEDNYFGVALLGPWVLFLVVSLLQVRPLEQLDLFAPAFPMALVFFKIACLFAGCCYGVESEFGLYSPARNRVEVPIQWIECIVAAVIFLIMLLVRVKLKRGTGYPLYLILYSATRFVTEFWRGDFPQIAGPLTIYHFYCIGGVVWGVAMFVFFWFKGEKIDESIVRLFQRKKPKEEQPEA